MKKSLLLTLLLCVAVSASAQTYTGRVVDAEDGKPVVGAIIAGEDAEGRSAGYTTSSAEGLFRLTSPEGRRAVRLDVSMMGYRRQSVAATDAPLEIPMTPEALDIREVTIRAPRLSMRGDTVSYHVGSFTEAQDRTIADVLRKMPGIEVEPSGQIRYNGDPINKFYIEGMDMLDGRYSLATNNIAPQDVANVEVLENHQPIKALDKIAFSDRAAINLRLKEHARAHWTGMLRGAAGWSPTLWNAGLFTMRIGAGSQSMFSAKSDNTGQNPTTELRRLSTEDLLNGGDNLYDTSRWLYTGTSSAPLGDQRTRFNRSHLASADNLWKLSNDYQLSSHIAYGYDRTTSDYAAQTVRFLPEGELEEHSSEQARLRDQQLAAQVKLSANTERFYLLDRLSADLAWSDFRAVVAGSYPNRQTASTPAHRVENDLNYIRRLGNRSLTVTSNVLYLAQPQWLDVLRAESRQRQEVGVNLFRMNHNATYGVQAGRRFSLLFKAGVSALFRNLESDLTGVETAVLGRERSSFGYAGAYLQPSATYRSSKLRLTLDLPVEYRRYWLGEQHDNAAIWSGRTSIRWEASAYWALSASGSIGSGAPDDSRIYPGAILRDYRTLTTGVTSFDQTMRRSLSAGINYKNPLNGLFFHLLAMRQWNELPLLSTRQFEGDYIIDGWLSRSNRTATWRVTGGVSKNIDALHGQIGLDASYQNSDMQTLQEGSLMHYRNETLVLSPRFNFRFAQWFNAEYAMNYRRTQLRIEGQNNSTHQSFDHRLMLNFVPVKNVVLQLTGEHYYSQLSARQSKHLVLADVMLRWKVGERWELTASVMNLFDKTEYAYTLFDGLSSSTARYAIRPRNVLFGANWKF